MGALLGAIKKTARTPALPGFLFLGPIGIVRWVLDESDGIGDGMGLGVVDGVWSIPSGLVGVGCGVGLRVGQCWRGFRGGVTVLGARKRVTVYAAVS